MSSSRPEPVPGRSTSREVEHLIDSTQFLELEALPERIVFVGSGYIAFESRISPPAAAPTASSSTTASVRSASSTPTSSASSSTAPNATGSPYTKALKSPEWSGSCLVRGHDQEGAQSTLTADLVVHAAGRVADLHSLGLDAANVACGPSGCRSPTVCRAPPSRQSTQTGDAAQTPGGPLAPIAVIEGKVAASNLLKGTQPFPTTQASPARSSLFPNSTESDARARARSRGMDIDVRYTDAMAGLQLPHRQTTGAANIIIERRTNLVLSAHLLGHDYAELVNTVGLAIELGLTTSQLGSAVAAYPSTGSDLSSLL